MELVLTPEKIAKINIPIEEFIYLWLKSIDVEPNFGGDIPLIAKGYLYTTGKPTAKGINLIEEVLANVSSKVDNYEELYKKLQDRLVSLTGKKQVKANGSYTYLCNSIDLKSKLSKVIRKYKLNDFEKVTKLLLLHIDKSHRQKFDKVMLIQYYIEKNNVSTLASDYESYKEQEQQDTSSFKSNQKFL
jgi:hypothetical protein